MNACGVPVLIGITRSLVKQGDRPQDRRARLSFLEHAARHHVRSADLDGVEEVMILSARYFSL